MLFRFIIGIVYQFPGAGPNFAVSRFFTLTCVAHVWHSYQVSIGIWFERHFVVCICSMFEIWHCFPYANNKTQIYIWQVHADVTKLSPRIRTYFYKGGKVLSHVGYCINFIYTIFTVFLINYISIESNCRTKWFTSISYGEFKIMIKKPYDF